MLQRILGLGDIPNSEKALILSSATAYPIDLGLLENLLDTEEILWRNEISGNWTGPLVDYMTGNSDAIADGIKELLRHMGKTRSTQIDSHLPEWAVKCKGLLDGLLLAGVITQEQSDAVVALGGGVVYADTTEADVASALEEWETSEAERIAQAEAEAAAAAAELVIDGQVASLDARYVSAFNANIAPLIDLRNVDELAWKAAIENMAATFIPAE